MKLIPLSRTGKNKDQFYAQVDDKHYDWLSTYKWYLQIRENTNYAASKIEGKQVLMHRLIKGVTGPTIMVDHEDGNGLNCQERNLRIATRSQNGANRKGYGRSSFLGVYLMKKKNRWRADITVNKKHIYIGVFDTEIEAAEAYNTAALQHHGTFARLNIIPQTVDKTTGQFAMQLM